MKKLMLIVLFLGMSLSLLGADFRGYNWGDSFVDFSPSAMTNYTDVQVSFNTVSCYFSKGGLTFKVRFTFFDELLASATIGLYPNSTDIVIKILNKKYGKYTEDAKMLKYPLVKSSQGSKYYYLDRSARDLKESPHFFGDEIKIWQNKKTIIVLEEGKLYYMSKKYYFPYINKILAHQKKKEEKQAKEKKELYKSF